MVIVRTCLLVLMTLGVPASSMAGASRAADCPRIDGGDALLTSGDVLLLGELHGTNESPAFVGSLACHAVAKGLDVFVGLELSPSIHADVTRFLDSPGGVDHRARLVASPQWQRDYQDGRTSRAMVDLIDAVRLLQGKSASAQVLLFDSGGPGQERERGMAANIAESASANPEALHLILTGNLHSRLSKGSRRDAEYEPMGYLVKAALPSRSVTALNVSHWGGSAWICAPECGIASLGGGGDMTRGTVSIDEDSRPAGHSGWYGVGAISASPPASGASCKKLFEEQLPSLGADYRGFDQTPAEGWRKLSRNECLPEAVELIERYMARHEDLLAGDVRILSFHMGQLLARNGDYVAAIPRFEAALNADEPAEGDFKWNAYVRASVAFLRGDLKELIAQRSVVATSAPRGGRVPNLDVVDRLVEGIGTGYRAAYSGPPPVAEKKKPTPVPVELSESSKHALAAWQGHWQAYDRGYRAWTLRVEGGKFHGVMGPDDEYAGTLAIRTKPDPDEIDFIIEDCNCGYIGGTSRAIFRVEGDGFRLIAPHPDSERPKAFDGRPGRAVTLKRVSE